MKKPVQKKPGKKVTFRYYAPQAQKVHIAGDFNQWNPYNTPLSVDAKGRWEVVLELVPGRYEYRYWIDGEWFNEQHPVECVPNVFGTWNCVLEVPGV